MTKMLSVIVLVRMGRIFNCNENNTEIMHLREFHNSYFEQRCHVKGLEIVKTLWIVDVAVNE